LNVTRVSTEGEAAGRNGARGPAPPARKGPQSRRVRAASGARRKALELSQRQRLVHAMIELSAQRGYHEVSIAALCAGAGVSPVTFYEEFHDKEEVLIGAYRLCAESLFGPMRSVLFDAKTADVQRLALEAMLEAIAEDPDAGRIVFVEALGAGERMLKERTQAFERFERRVQEYMGRLPGDSTLDVPVSAVAGALRHIVARDLRNHAEDQLPSRLPDGLAWLSRYLRTARDEPWSTSQAAVLDGAFLELPPPPARPAGPERLPRGRHRLPASVVARSQRTRLLYATAEVTMQKGYAGSKVEDIVAAAGVAKPVFYQFFTDKEHAFLEAQQFPTQFILDRCVEAYFSVDEWPERVWRCIQTLIELIVSNPPVSHLRLVECYSAGPEAIRRAEEITRSFTMFLAEGRRYKTQARSLPRLTEQAIAGALFEIVQREAAAGRYRTLISLLPRLTYIALAPFTGADEAIELVEGLKGAELAGARA
jgi:TetR/AcrR family transcriptional regulator